MVVTWVALMDVMLVGRMASLLVDLMVAWMDVKMAVQMVASKV
jgi:hypothetical protein